MKKILPLILGLSFLSSCLGLDDAFMIVQKEFPKYKTIQQEHYIFVIIDSNDAVWFVKCNNVTNNQISFKQKIK